MTFNFIDTLARASRLASTAALLCLAVALAGCQSVPVWPESAAPADNNALILHAGDSIKVDFPGAPNLSASTTIRLDGKISLPSIGEVTASGMTPADLEKKLLTLAGPQIVVKQVNVTVLSSTFMIYMEGAVLRPGKLNSDRVLTPLEALSDAGIDFQRANLRAVHVIRRDGSGRTRNYKINVQSALDGKSSESFTLKPFDILYVPERFTWF